MKQKVVVCANFLNISAEKLDNVTDNVSGQGITSVVFMFYFKLMIDCWIVIFYQERSCNDSLWLWQHLAAHQLD